ncbi:major facilitator superfamily domain-containing protein [Aspergillus aurantiobrunneus]
MWLVIKKQKPSSLPRPLELSNGISVVASEVAPSSRHDFTTVKRTGKDVDIVDEEISRETALTALTVHEERRLIRRIDWRLVPLLCMLYLMKKIDENNATNARIINKGTDRNILTQLGISSDQFGMITVLYTVPYILAEIPSNLILKVRPSGIVTACTAAVKNLAGLYTVRCMLGLTEAGMFPAIILQLTYWYGLMKSRSDSVGNVAGIIGGVLAYAFHGISGAGNVSGWQWLFIVEGAVTIVLAVVVLFCIPDFPATTKWLSPTERAFLQARLPQNSPRATENFVFKEVIKTFCGLRLWLFTFSWACMTSGSSGVKFYQPTIIANMGFSDIATAQILNIPMSVLTIIFIIIGGYTSSLASIPLPLFPITCTVVIIACYSVLVAYPNDIGVYIAMMISNAVSVTWFPMMWSWRSQTVNGATGSAFAVAFVNSYRQVGDAVGPQIFQDKYEPRYQLPLGLAMGLVALWGVTNSYTWWVTRQTERDTRRHKLARLRAKLENEAVLDDVSDCDLGGRERV